ncbi:hypothetical protein PIB30_080053 [Stylosanthes scabra]|uniref:Aminotransferase-like plant mobile domain-containing protein n=1 Tax=Stylosanthes scabra TaxID=79078 RepID=A0ABU6SRR6_9FABA|nr:hypothetical protein [Stylosanthes scabra]
MERLAPAYGDQWETLGLTQALHLACEDLSYVAPMLSACLYFWCPTTNNFHFRYEMMGPTLLEVYAFTGLSADAEAMSAGSECPEISDAAYPLDYSGVTAFRIIQNNVVKDEEPITELEHISSGSSPSTNSSDNVMQLSVEILLPIP